MRLLSEEPSCQVADEDFVTAGGFESLEMVKLLPENDPGILSATHKTYTFCFMQKTRKCTDSNELSLFIKKLKRWYFYFISNISYRVNMTHNRDKKILSVNMYVMDHKMKQDSALCSIFTCFPCFNEANTLGMASVSKIGIHLLNRMWAACK